MMSVEEYLASIDWGGAFIAGVVIIAVAAILLRFLMASTSEVGSMLPRATEAAGRKVLDVRSDLPVDTWVCEVCRSVNLPTATRCYRGCGTRAEIGRVLPADPWAAVREADPGSDG